MQSALGSFEKRQAVTAWRDRWRLHLWMAMSEAGQQALQKLDSDLSDAGILDVYITNAAFADPRIDRSMLLSMRNVFYEIRMDIASSLHDIDPGLDTLGFELSQIDFDQFMPKMPDFPDEQVLGGAIANTKLSLKEKIASSAMGGAVTVAVGLVSAPEALIGTAVYAAANMAAPHFHDWIRNAGSKRLADVWLGTIGEPLPVMPKVAAVFDNVAERARSLLS